jgi:hypothetical protein
MRWAVLAVALGARIGEQALAALESPGDITRVITSLDALVQAVADETKARLVVSNGVKSWCEDTISEKKHAIDSSKDSAEQAGVDLAAAEAEVESSTAKVDEVKRAITAANGELSELEKKFDKQKAEYKEALKALTDARSDVQTSLLSHDAVVRPDVNMDKLRTLDTQLLRGASFLQLGKLNSKQASAASDAEDEMEKEKEQLDESWAAEQKEAAELMGAKKKQLLDLSSDLESAQLTVGMVKTKAASLTREKASAERIAKREGELLVGIEANCEANAKFAAEQEELRSEQGTKLREAIGLIKALTRTAMVQFAAPAFVQLSAIENPSEMLELFQGAETPAATSDATTVAPVALAQAQAQAQTSSGGDPLAEIKGKIQGMLDALKAAENAEKGPADFCSTELGTNREKKMQKSNDVDMGSAEMRAADLAKQGLEQTMNGATLGRNALSAERARLDAERGTEKKRIEEESKDHDLAIEVLDKAVSLVNEEFASSLIQTGQETSKQVDAAKAVDALTAVRDSVATQTKAAQAHLTELETRTDSQLSSLDEAVRARDQEISEAKAGAAEQADVYSQAKEGKQTAQAELASIVTYLENLGQQCGPSLGNTYEELKRQREEEINGLKEALQVLAGEAVPALSLSQAAVLESKPLTATQRAAAAIGV